MLRSLFNLLWPYHVQVEVTFECDVSIKAGEHVRSDFDIHFNFFQISCSCTSLKEIREAWHMQKMSQQTTNNETTTTVNEAW